MSFCQILNRNQMHDQTSRYLTLTAEKLRSFLQCWLATNLDSPWMYTYPISESIDDDALFYPLALVDVNHQGKCIS